MATSWREDILNSVLSSRQFYGLLLLLIIGTNQNASAQGLRVELPEILIETGWLDVENDVQLEAYFPSVRIGGSNIGTDNLCMRGDHFESLRPVPIWGERERGEETDRYIIGYETAKIPRFKTKQHCVIEVRDECKKWTEEVIELARTVSVDVFRSHARDGQVVAYTRRYTIPDCE